MQLTKDLNVYTITSHMGRPPKPEHLRRDKMLPLRLTMGEWEELQEAASKLGVKVAEILREGAKLYIKERQDGPLDKRRKKQ